ncbi:MAG TPA: hypothetical protein DCW35_02965 [Polynucleobacter sp.]|nr:hypothetical protein [Polynucleobacter sp.]
MPRKYNGGLDPYQRLAFSFIFGLSVWVPISALAYGFSISTDLLTTIVLSSLFLIALKFRSHLLDVFLVKNYFNFINTYSLLILVCATLVGFISQYQTGDGDAFAHIASIRNLAISEKILSCDWILGGNAPMTSAYGCNPWYLILGLISRLSGVDIALGYQYLCGLIFSLWVVATYSFIKEISNSSYLAKLGSIGFVIVSVSNWLIIIGNNSYYSLDPINNLIFPQHLISYILFPTTLIFLVRYLKYRLYSDLVLTLICFLVASRTHPSWLFWAPILIVGILFFNKIGIQNKNFSWIYLIKLLLIIFFISIISFAGYILCSNTYSSDINIISPIALWRDSGGNLLFISNFIYLYDPKSYFSERAIFDFGTILLLRYLSKITHLKYSEQTNKSRAEIFNLLFWVYIGTLTSVFLVIFNPLLVYLVINYLKSSVVLYRVFGLITPFLGCITIYAVLDFLKLKLSFKSFRNTIIVALIASSLIIVSWRADYFLALLQNRGGYYSTHNSLTSSPFLYFRTLTPGVIVLDAPMSTPVAALTELDPIITEVWRAKSIEDIAINKDDNDSLLSFSKSRSELLEIITRRNVRYIYLSKNNLINSQNFKENPDLVHLKSVIDGAELWEVNESLL